MNDGKVVPCKHCGRDAEVVIGNFVLCPVCDRVAVPKHVEPEKTEPLPRPNWWIRTDAEIKDDDFWSGL